MPVETIANMMGKIALMVLLGFILKKRGIITSEMQKALSQLLMTAVLPLSILSSANVALSKELSTGLIQVAVIAFAYYVLSILSMHLLSRFLKIDTPSRKIFVTMTVFANNAFIGFPIVGELFGEKSVLYAVVFNTFYQLFMFTYGTASLSGKTNLKSLLKNPLTIASFVSLAVFLSPFRFPEFIQSAMSTVGSMTVPLSMLIIGCTLTDMRPSQILRDKYSYLVSAMRLLIFPLLMFAAMKLLRVPTLVASICVLMSALPCGSLNVILAEQYDCNPSYAARTVVQSMILMLPLLPLFIFLTHYL